VTKLLLPPLSAAVFLLGGCALPLLGGLTMSETNSGTSVVSTALTGKGLGEHALDAVTGQDCRITESLFRADRDVCEDRDSPATKDDFKGVAALF